MSAGPLWVLILGDGFPSKNFRTWLYPVRRVN